MRCLLCSPLVNFLLSLLLMHSGYNMLGELTRFGDREFYQVRHIYYRSPDDYFHELQDWWSSFGHSEYHRRWNIVAYDFFHAYFYQDLSQVSSTSTISTENVTATTACAVHATSKHYSTFNFRLLIHSPRFLYWHHDWFFCACSLLYVCNNRR